MSWLTLSLTLALTLTLPITLTCCLRKQVDTPDPTAEELADMRVRICVGMKRYFHQKNVEGLLSNSVRPPAECDQLLSIANVRGLDPPPAA